MHDLDALLNILDAALEHCPPHTRAVLREAAHGPQSRLRVALVTPPDGPPPPPPQATAIDGVGPA